VTLPNLESFNLTLEETAAKTIAITQTDCSPWDIDNINCSNQDKQHLKSIKTKIRAFHLAAQENYCCYCRTPTVGNVDFIVDREHILPKGTFPEYTYEIWNLSVSCKRCNMSYKKERIDFIIDFPTIKTNPTNPNRYQIVHPNFECWTDHLSKFSHQEDNKILVVFKTKSQKGVYTKTFFNLSELEKNTFDAFQGKLMPDAINEKIKSMLPDV